MGAADQSACVYGLIDPETQELRYVGLTTTPAKRSYTHRSRPQKRDRSHRAQWLRRVFDRGERPEWLVIEECAAADLAEAEAFWIAYFKGIGARLTNHRDGGDRGYRVSATARAKMSASVRAAYARGGMREKMSAAKTGKPAWNRGKAPSDEHRAKVSAALRGRKTTRDVTICRRGHALTPANTYVAPRGNRACRICRAAAR